MKLKIKTLSSKAKEMYENHGHFHPGDAGLDLFVMKRQIIQPGHTSIIKLDIACENVEMKPYFLMPRSSISKTPLRMCNSIGLIDVSITFTVCFNINSHILSLELRVNKKN